MSSIGTPASMKDYDAQYDADTLTRAAEIKADGERHGRAKAFAAAKVKALKSVAGEVSKTLPSAESQLQKGFRPLK